MQDKIIKLSQQDLSESDRAHFERAMNNNKTENLVYTNENQDIKVAFSQYGRIENITSFHIKFVDSEGGIHEVTQDKDSLFKIRIFFSSHYRILVAYETLNQPETKFCSWGYKKSSARTETLFVYFKTEYAAYMAYADAKHPEYQFLLSADDIGHRNPIQNQYQFLKSLTEKDSE